MKVHRIAAFVINGRGGNPAGVVLANRLPPDDVMRRIARDVGYSETAFAAPRGEVWDTRYFSPESEVPFCGHATIALGAVMANERGAGIYHLELKQGQITVEAQTQGGHGYSILHSPPTSSRIAPPDMLHEALSLFGYSGDDLDPALPAMFANGGSDHLIISLRTRALLARMRYSLDEGRIFMHRHGLVTVAFVWREAPRIFRARNAFASGGVLEDPATGAAAAALAGMLRDRELLSCGDLIVYQGEDMGRPSKIDVSFSAVPGSAVSVGGASAPL